MPTVLCPVGHAHIQRDAQVQRLMRRLHKQAGTGWHGAHAQVQRKEGKGGALREDVSSPACALLVRRLLAAEESRRSARGRGRSREARARLLPCACARREGRVAAVWQPPRRPAGSAHARSKERGRRRAPEEAATTARQARQEDNGGGGRSGSPGRRRRRPGGRRRPGSGSSRVRRRLLLVAQSLVGVAPQGRRPRRQVLGEPRDRLAAGRRAGLAGQALQEGEVDRAASASLLSSVAPLPGAASAGGVSRRRCCCCCLARGLGGLAGGERERGQMRPLGLLRGQAGVGATARARRPPATGCNKGAAPALWGGGGDWRGEAALRWAELPSSTVQPATCHLLWSPSSRLFEQCGKGIWTSPVMGSV